MNVNKSDILTNYLENTYISKKEAHAKKITLKSKFVFNDYGLFIPYCYSANFQSC